MWKVLRNNNEDLGFALNCLFNQAISLKEFREWLEIVIEDNDISNVPSYIFELLDFGGKLFELNNIIGFTSDYEPSEKDEKAVIGIAFLRNTDVYDVDIDKAEAIKALKANNDIYQKFVKFFPFVKLPSLYDGVSTEFGPYRAVGTFV